MADDRWRREYDYMGTPTVESWSISCRVSMRHSSGIDYYSVDTGDPVYVHLSPDASPEEIGVTVRKAIDRVVESFQQRRSKAEAERVLREATPSEIADALEVVRRRRTDEQ